MFEEIVGLYQYLRHCSKTLDFAGAHAESRVLEQWRSRCYISRLMDGKEWGNRCQVIRQHSSSAGSVQKRGLERE